MTSASMHYTNVSDLRSINRVRQGHQCITLSEICTVDGQKDPQNFDPCPLWSRVSHQKVLDNWHLYWRQSSRLVQFLQCILLHLGRDLPFLPHFQNQSRIPRQRSEEYKWPETPRRLFCPAAYYLPCKYVNQATIQKL